MFKNLSLGWKILATLGTAVVGIAGIISAYYTVKAYYYPPNSTPQNTAQTTTSNQITTLQPLKNSKVELCKNKYAPLFDTIGSLSLSYKRDEGYLNACGSAISEGCFEEAFVAITHLSLSYQRDEQYEKLYKEEIKKKEYSLAKKSIDNLSLSYKKDEGYEALSAAIANSN